MAKQQLKIWTRAPWRSPVSAVNVSKNNKLGPISTTSVSQQSCPGAKQSDKYACPFLNDGCYAEWQGMQPFTTRRLNSNDTTHRLTLAKIEADAVARLDGRSDLRGHVVGDCATPSGAGVVGTSYVKHTRRHGKRAWTYTHAYRTVPLSAWQGAQVVASVHTAADYTAARAQGYTTIALAVTDRHPTHKVYTDTHTGLAVLPCPAQFDGPKVQCIDCSICQDPTVTQRAGADVVGFQPDGLKKVKRGA